MTALVSLTMAQVLPAARKAFTERRLQAQKPGLGLACLYTGPCAIGAAIDPAVAAELDTYDNTEIDALVGAGIVDAPEAERDDFVRLQLAHDSWMTDLHTSEDFADVLSQLEKKYLS